MVILCVLQPTDLVSKLYAAHQNGQINSGFDATAESSESFITDAADHCILDLAKTKVRNDRLLLWERAIMDLVLQGRGYIAEGVTVIPFTGAVAATCDIYGVMLALSTI